MRREVLTDIGVATAPGTSASDYGSTSSESFADAWCYLTDHTTVRAGVV
jgi:hypothetical protein